MSEIVEVVLKKAHNGQPAGAVLLVDEVRAAVMVKAKLARLASDPELKPKTKTEAAEEEES